MRTPRTVTFRKWKYIDQTAFSNSVISISGDMHLTPLDEKVSQLNNTLFANLDTFAALMTCKVTFARSAPWYNDNLHTKKAACQNMERKWHLTGLNVYYLAWKDLLGDYRALIESAISYFYQTIENNQGNLRHLFKTINCLLQVDAVSTMPVSQQLCNSFL